MPEIKRSIKNRAAWQRGIKFFVEDLWRLDFSELTHVRKSLYQGLQIFFLVAEGFMKDKLLLRASALTYSTLLAIVPLLAFMFAVLKGMGVQRRLEPMILERAGIGSQEIITKVLTYIDNVNVGSLGALGLIILILTVIAILGNIEKAFNDI
ncbi:YihY/virulence factor BrkB family protein, partial [bacterium]|nr:YihY/virulence factor BrkB family protein [bacterium]